MNDRLVVLSFHDGEVGVTLSTNYRYFTVPCNLTVVYMTASASANDTGLTIDLNDDASTAIAAVDAADADVPGTWKSTHMGGTNAPVNIAAGSVCSLDANAAAANTRVHVEIWALTGETFA